VTHAIRLGRWQNDNLDVPESPQQVSADSLIDASAPTLTVEDDDHRTFHMLDTDSVGTKLMDDATDLRAAWISSNFFGFQGTPCVEVLLSKNDSPKSKLLLRSHLLDLTQQNMNHLPESVFVSKRFCRMNIL